MGKCHSKSRVPVHVPFKPRDYYNWATDHRQLTHREKCNFLFFIRDNPEDEVISYFKENLHVLSCLFWFEIFRSKTDETVTCSCSKHLELCYTRHIARDENIKRLEIALTSAECPHVFLFRRGIDVNVNQDIQSSEITENYEVTIPEVAYRNAMKETAGIYWIHLAVIYRKVKIVHHILPLAIEHKVADYLLSEKHSISPISLALCHKSIEMAWLIMKYHKTSLFQSARKIGLPSWYAATPINMALWLNEFEAFKAIYNKVYAKDLRTAYYVDTFYFWADKVMEMMQSGESEKADVLLSVNIGIIGYVMLFQRIHMTDSYWMCEKVFSTRDFRKELRTSDKPIKLRLQDMMIRAVFTGDSKTVQAFLDNGFDANTQFKTLTILSLSEAFSYGDVSRVLRSANAIESSSLVSTDLIKALAIYEKPQTDFSLTFDPVPLIHRLFEVRHDLNSLNLDDVVMDVWLHQYKNENVFTYLLLRGCDPSIVAHYLSQKGWQYRYKPFLYHLITNNAFIDIGKMVQLYAMNFSDDEPFYYQEVYNVNMEESTRFKILGELVQSSLSSPAFDYIQRTFFKYSPNAVQNFILNWVRPVEEPRTLKSICRHTLRLHFRGIRFHRFLHCEKERIPESVLDYLQMTEYQNELFRSDKEKLKKLQEVSNQVKAVFNVQIQ